MKTITCKACELTEHLKDEFGHPEDLDSSIHKGFTIGNGKKMYWYFIWHPSGNATVFDTEYPMNKRYIKGEQEITVHFKS